MWVLVLTIGSVTSDLGHHRHTAHCCPPAHCSDTHQDPDTLGAAETFHITQSHGSEMGVGV